MSNIEIFQKKSGGTLEERALFACKVIVEEGLAIKDGEIVDGRNSDKANEAAMAFTDKDLRHFRVFSASLKNQAIAGMICARQQYAKTKMPEFLEIVVIHATSLRLHGGLQEAKIDRAMIEPKLSADGGDNLSLSSLASGFMNMFQPNISNTSFDTAVYQLQKPRP